MITRQVAQPADNCYIVPARTIRGSRAEMLADIEDAVRALMALRLVILAEAPAAQSSSAAKR
jgi:hypothetical protein